MCVVSMVGDHYLDRWQKSTPIQDPIYNFNIDQLSKEEIDQLREFIRNDLPEFRKFLESAREYDKNNNELSCENQEKYDKIRQYAKDLGLEDEIEFLNED